VGECKGSFVIRGAFNAQSDAVYPLINSAILDSGTTIHIFNQKSRFQDLRRAPSGDYVWAGETQVPILAYGTVDIQVQGPQNTRILRLQDVALCSGIVCNLVSLRQLQKRGTWWDTRPEFNCLRRADNSILCTLTDRYDQFVLEYIPFTDRKRAAFISHKFNSWTKRKPAIGDAIRWHRRLGHPGPGALEHFVNCSKGVRIRGPTTVECEACAVAKIKRQIRRQPRELLEGPGERLAIDFHDFQEGLGGYTSLMLFTDRWSGLAWDFYLQDRKAKSIIAAISALFQILEKRYSIIPKVVECDNEITEIKPQVRTWLESKAVKIEPSAPYTQSQNGGAERSGGVIKEKGRAMRADAKFPAFLWPEISRAAVYLYNRTPKYIYSWKSPYERFFTRLAHREGVVIESRKPNQAHLRAYGCKAYAMTSSAQKKEQRLQRFNPKAWIGLLIGYNSSNIYRIWVPSQNRVISARDVIFNENDLFNGDIQNLKDNLLRTSIEEFAELLKKIALPEVQEDIPEAMEDDPEFIIPSSLDMALEGTQQEEDLESSCEAETAFYPTPSPTPPAALLAHSIRQAQDPEATPDLEDQAWRAAFCAGRLSAPIGKFQGKVVDRAQVHRLREKGKLTALKSAELPPPPRWHHELRTHAFGALFEQAELDHLESHRKLCSWTEIPRAQGKQIIDSMWVYVYKCDKHGRFQKCKARLVVRGDQESKASSGETYAATLAGRSFRTLIAIAARFDLELKQYDVVNAFVNAKLPYDAFMSMPKGYSKPGRILKLNKALYGLRASPLLWQKEFGSTLQGLGYEPVPHEPCCYMKNGIIVFFYVDDVVLAYRKAQEQEAQELVNALQQKYELTGGHELQWFLGIQVIRSRQQRLIWLSQSAYIEKISKLADNKDLPCRTPIASMELFPNDRLSTMPEIRRYQKKIGSLLYAAVVTRPDIAFATSRLARFLANPGPSHQEAADRVLLYLQRTQGLALQLGGGDDLVVASDASFADNTLDRKSSQAYAMKLFGGLIGWRASKQDTVATSTTEAELLALSQAAKEALFVSRLIKELSVQLDDQHIRIQCDNKQTIRLVTAETALLQTKLRHIDIHNHWLRQEVSTGRIAVEYTPSQDMLADGLTKALQNNAFDAFVQQLGLVDITEKLGIQELQELDQKNYLENEGNDHAL
jgi:hypothetical protein